MNYLSQFSARKLAQEILPTLNVQTNKMGYRQVYLLVRFLDRQVKLAYGVGHTWEEALESARGTKEKYDKEIAEREEAKKMVLEAAKEVVHENSPGGSEEAK